MWSSGGSCWFVVFASFNEAYGLRHDLWRLPTDDSDRVILPVPGRRWSALPPPSRTTGHSSLITPARPCHPLNVKDPLDRIGELEERCEALEYRPNHVTIAAYLASPSLCR